MAPGRTSRRQGQEDGFECLRKPIEGRSPQVHLYRHCGTLRNLGALSCLSGQRTKITGMRMCGTSQLLVWHEVVAAFLYHQRSVWRTPFWGSKQALAAPQITQVTRRSSQTLGRRSISLHFAEEAQREKTSARPQHNHNPGAQACSFGRHVGS